MARLVSSSVPVGDHASMETVTVEVNQMKVDKISHGDKPSIRGAQILLKCSVSDIKGVHYCTDCLPYLSTTKSPIRLLLKYQDDDTCQLVTNVLTHLGFQESICDQVMRMLKTTFNRAISDYYHKFPDARDKLLTMAASFNIVRILYSSLVSVKDGDMLNDKLCAICLEDLFQSDAAAERKENIVTKLPYCQHAYHEDCFKKWIVKDKFSCPVCRSSCLSKQNLACKF